MLSERVVFICAAVYMTMTIALSIRNRNPKSLFFSTALVSALFVLARLLSIRTDSINGFGASESPAFAIVLMFFCTAAGIVGRYLFYLREDASFLELVRPLAISPIVLLPLYGSIEGIDQLKPIQLVSFCLLAYQNGFFWQAVLARVESRVDRRSRPKSAKPSRKNKADS